MPENLRLYLIRHGETEWSLSGQHTSRTDLPLTPNGEDQARKLAPRLSGITFSHVFTSPLLRARQTCEIAGLAAMAEAVPELMEWDYGDYEGRKSVDIHQSRPGWNVFSDGCPAGEMPDQISDRADRLISRLEKLDGNIALFTHGQFGSSLATRWIGLAVPEAQHLPLGTASLSILGFSPGHQDVKALLLWNSPSD